MSIRDIKFIVMDSVDPKDVISDYDIEVKVREDKPFKWLQKLVAHLVDKFELLSITLKPESRRTVKVVREYLPSEVSFATLYRQVREFTKQTGKLPSRVLIGYPQYTELLHLTSDNHFAFETSYKARGVEDKIMGLTIEIIPWMSGIIVMPDPPRVISTG